MGENSAIAWCTHTFNPWIGCQKVSAGCDFCYAETLMDKRYHRVEWGPHGERKRTSPANWKLPLRWAKAVREHRQAWLAGITTSLPAPTRPRVFCASLADVFDNKAPYGARADLWRLIWDTPELDWLLLTKRPENIEEMLPESWQSHRNEWRHVWLGATCEDQASYDRRWPVLQRIPAAVRFISYEPAIGPLTLSYGDLKVPDWIICGGETGPGHRDMPSIWAEDMMEECDHFGIPFFMKQMAGRKLIPADLMVRQFPGAVR